MTTETDDRGSIDTGLVIQKALAEAGRRALWGRVPVALCEGWAIEIEREWVEDNEDVTDKMILKLVWTGPSKAGRVLSSVKCNEMFEVLGNVSKLIEDCQRAKWNANSMSWHF